LIYSIIYGLQKESYNPNQIGYSNNNNIPISENNYKNISPQNNYMFTSDQKMGNFQNKNQIKTNNNLGKIIYFTIIEINQKDIPQPWIID